MEDNFNKIINGVKNDLLKIKRKNQSEICKSKPKKIRLDHRLPPGCLQLHLHPNGYQIVLSEPKQQSAFIPYSNREILSAIESGRMPAILSDWITPEKIKISNQNLIKCAILEKNSAGQTLSTRLIDLKNNSHGSESSQIINETSQLYRWGYRDRLILDSCLSISTSEPLCLNPSPAVHLLNNLTQNRIRSDKPKNNRTYQNPQLQQKAPMPPCSKSLHPGPVQVPIFPSVSCYRLGTIREVHLKTLINSRTKTIYIRLISKCPDGSFDGHIKILDHMGELIHETQFHPQSPNEAEQFLRQFVELYSNNDPLNSTVQLVRNGEIFYDQTDQVQRKDFPNPFFEELANGRTDLLSEKSNSPSLFSSSSEGRPLSSSVDGIESMDM